MTIYGTGLPQIADESVDLIFVDPPYDGRAVDDLYSYITSVAGRILKEGGSLAVMCDGAHLEKAIKELTSDKRLRYNWDIAYICKRESPLIHTRKVVTGYKHVLWFTKGHYEGTIVYDVVEAPPDPDGADKTYHVWGQSVAGVKEILHRLSKDGGVVCDLMCGGGSTVIAALELGGRKVIACDVDEDAIKVTKKRVCQFFENADKI